MRTYIAIDPGVVSGIAVWDDERGWDKLQTWEAPYLSEEGAMFGHDLVRSHLLMDGKITIVTEKFTINTRTARGKVYYESLYFNGWLDGEYPGQVFEQTPAQAKGFATDGMLKHLGWWRPSKDGHANDAIRHLVYRLQRDRNPELIERLEEYV